MDCRDPDTKIVFLSHDPPEIVVLAENVTELVTALMAGLDSPTLVSRGETEWGGFWEKLEAKGADDPGVIQNSPELPVDTGNLHIHKDGEYTYVDFNGAEVLDGVSLDLLGKYTEIDDGEEVGVLRFTVMSEDRIARMKRRDRVTEGFFIVVCLACMYYFYRDGYGLWGMAWRGVVFGFVICFFLGMTYIQIDEIRGKINKSRMVLYLFFIPK